MLVRLRTSNDVPGRVALPAGVQTHDGYAPRPPSSVEVFLCPNDLLGAWVADDDGRLTGHVALPGRSSRAVMAAASNALGLQDAQLVTGDSEPLDEHVYVAPEAAS